MEQVTPAGAETDDGQAEAVRLLRELTGALTVRGLAVRPEPERWSLIAVNEAAAPDNPRDPLAIAYGPARLVQRVQLGPDASGVLMWWWQWSGPTRDSGPEYEPLCPALEVDTAARRIANVLALVTP